MASSLRLLDAGVVSLSQAGTGWPPAPEYIPPITTRASMGAGGFG